MKNKSIIKERILITLTSMILTIIIVGGITYAFFYYGKTGSSNQLVVGDIYLNYTKTSANYLTINDAYPTKSYNPDNYLEFKVEGFNEYDQDIVYDISLIYGEISSNHTRIYDSSLKFTLLRSTDNGTTWTTVIDGQSYISINNRRIYANKIDKETSTLTTHLYRLYMWIPDTVIISNDSRIGDYTFSEWENIEANIKVKVTGDFVSKTVYQDPILVMTNPSYIGGIQAVKSSITSITVSNNPTIPNNAVTVVDMTDYTSSGDVKFYTIDDGRGNNTYSAVICGDGYIYAPANFSWAFYDFTNLETIDFKNLKTDYVTTIQGVFSGCYKLEDVLTLYNWDTSNVVNMSQLFYNCQALQSLNGVDKWDTSSNETLYYTFGECHKLSDINSLVNWDVSSVTDLSGTFDYTDIRALAPLAKWDTANVTTLRACFYYCLHLNDLTGLNNWNTAGVTNIEYMFCWCTNLVSLKPLFYWNTSSVETLSGIFSSCKGLHNLEGLNDWDVTSCKYFSYAFQSCKLLADISAIADWEITTCWNLTGLFSDCSILSDISPLANWTTTSVYNIENIFEYCGLLVDLTPLANWNTQNVLSASGAFTGCYSIRTLDALENWNVQNVESFGSSDDYGTHGMFEGLYSLTDASAINDWQINSAASFLYMFKNTSVKPEFTNVNGTWDNDGTFIPS